jgi:hypothetical protein
MGYQGRSSWLVSNHRSWTEVGGNAPEPADPRWQIEKDRPIHNLFDFLKLSELGVVGLDSPNRWVTELLLGMWQNAAISSLLNPAD